jgi:hypothetical protein
LYLALHSLMVSACAELCATRTAANAAATNKNLRVVIGCSSVKDSADGLESFGDTEANRGGVHDVQAHPATRPD